MSITHVTRRALLADLLAGRHWWAGDLHEPEFLARLYPLDELPSADPRYDDARSDIFQHRVNNVDGDDDWVFDDPRFRLGESDDLLLRFLAETIHPEVRSDQAEVQALLKLYNKHLRHDGWELYPHGTISGRPVYAPRHGTAPPPTVRELREAIASTISDGLRAYEVAEFCEAQLGLPPPKDRYEDPMRGKAAYVRVRLNQKDEGELLVVARKVLAEFGDQQLATLIAAFESDSGGVQGPLRNLIFAADGTKPEIVLRDAINNDVEITKHAETCLVYDRPLDDAGLSWQGLVAWWGEAHPGENERAVALTLHHRLLRSLNTGPEQLTLDTYARLYRTHGFHIPALVPQVYLHFDPLTAWRRGGPGPLPRQRMDFLLLLPKRRRVVVEIDGKQHYSSDDGVASPERYAEMVREDRALRLNGYEVFRFGGAELTDPTKGRALLTDFFVALLRSYGLPMKS